MANPRIAFVDTYYPEVLPAPGAATYDARLAQLLALDFGTGSFYSDAFRGLGWDAIDIVANDDEGRALWAREHAGTSLSGRESVLAQLQAFRPDVVYVHDLSFFSPAEIARLRQSCGCRVVAQHGCPWAGDERVGAYDVVFTSCPHYLERIAALGVTARFLPIAFGQGVLDKVPPRDRTYDVAFVGGVDGSHGHWQRGTALLDALAAQVPGFVWFGYVIGDRAVLRRRHPSLERAWRGHAWGRRMYEIYAASRIVVNRHGEVAQGYANNMRLFEATGMGALLATERAPNLGDYFAPGSECVAYDGAEDLIVAVRRYLADDVEREQVARAGQTRTLREHTYERRLGAVEPLLRPR